MSVNINIIRLTSFFVAVLTYKIQKAVCKYIALKGHEAICENYGHSWEMDIASLSKSGMLHEYEVKISRSDFIADKKKKATKFSHYEMRNERTAPNYFYYVCPKGLIKKNEIPIYAGLYYYEDNKVWMVKNAKRIHKVPTDEKKTLRKMLRLNIQRKYLGGSMMTYLNRTAMERYKERMKENGNEIDNSLFADE